MINLKPAFLIVFSFLWAFQNLELVAQTEELKLSKEEISITVDSINSKLRSNYVFPEVADKMLQILKKKLKDGKYNSLTDPTELTRQLTSDLQSISKDKHLIVVFNPSVIARELSLTDEDRANEEAEWVKELQEHLKGDNYGFREIKIMEGNVGYINLREFVDPKYGGETLSTAMHFLSNTNAIIVDLRENDGGSPWMVQLLASYFFSSEPVHLSDHYNRPKNELTQSWTLPYVPGIRRPDVDLYILTSNKTFSAAEAFSYLLKCLNRATIIGESTAGGAHLTGSVIATDKFYVRIPQGRPTSPVTNGNWEGTGVTPHIIVNAEQALEIAHAKAREKLDGDK
ncbi:S41 family peptidase [Algoriphagus sp. AGSA1]|uniref:S41 family peptidase n=1 Tax=Algoriphagus sp. AGSA1 TaxID=2907213 RepID=UPI001F39C93E|nr:S41 family peptidase [Algoriphagus sp. AGSA1]MCE7053036.1 S41 family peptidase [Algoriphagus sp. AGSA1]